MATISLALSQAARGRPWLCKVNGGAAAVARYLLRRLKRRFPEAAVAALVVGVPENRLPEALHAEGAAARVALQLLPDLLGTA